MAASTETRHDVALTLLRLIIGIIFIMHGGQKLFVFGPSGTAGFFASIGAPLPGLTGPFIGVLEFSAGIALVIGLLTRLAALGLFCDMMGAITLVHGKNGFFAPKGYEFVLTLGVVALSIAIAGAGAYSLDALIARRRAA